MNPPFHYEVRITGVRYNSKDNIEFKNKVKEFRDENPLVSRQQSLDFYENYISGILQHLGYSYTSDRESRGILDSLFEKGSTKQIPVKDFDENISDILFFGMGVFFVVDRENENERDKKRSDKGSDLDELFNVFPHGYIIHGIGYNGLTIKVTPNHMMVGLYLETSDYLDYGFDLTGLMNQIEFYEYDIGDSDYNEILPTPFDWSGYDVPWKNEEEEPKKEVIQQNITFEHIIRAGESDQVEFKSTLKYNIDTQKGDQFLKSIIGKTICGFLNSRGGILFIGVDDGRIPIGLKNDYSLYGKKNPNDSFLKDFDNLLKTFLSQWVLEYIKVEFRQVNGVEIFIVSVSPSKNEPVFFNGQKEKEFYIRRMVSTTKLDVEDFFYYWKNHWSK